MVYIKNSHETALKFTVLKDNHEKTFVFDCKRIYSDTGNVATTGITELKTADFDFLKANCKQFNAFYSKGVLSQVSQKALNPSVAKIAELEKKNKELEAKLAEKEPSEKVEALEKEKDSLSKEVADKDKVIADLKKKLEAAAKSETKSKKE